MDVIDWPDICGRPLFCRPRSANRCKTCKLFRLVSHHLEITMKKYEQHIKTIWSWHYLARYNCGMQFKPFQLDPSIILTCLLVSAGLTGHWVVDYQDDCRTFILQRHSAPFANLVKYICLRIWTLSLLSTLRIIIWIVEPYRFKMSQTFWSVYRYMKSSTLKDRMLWAELTQPSRLHGSLYWSGLSNIKSNSSLGLALSGIQTLRLLRGELGAVADANRSSSLVIIVSSRKHEDLTREATSAKGMSNASHLQRFFTFG